MPVLNCLYVSICFLKTQPFFCLADLLCEKKRYNHLFKGCIVFYSFICHVTSLLASTLNLSASLRIVARIRFQRHLHLSQTIFRVQLYDVSA